MKPFAARMGINYRLVIGNDETAQLYGGIEALPTTFLVDRHGKIAAARALGLPVVMVRRPAPPSPGAFHDVEVLVEAAHRALALPKDRGE